VAVATDLWAEKFPGILLRFGLLILVFQRTRLSSVFGEFVSARRVGFALRKFLNLTFTEQKILCLKCVDDLSQILMFRCCNFLS
jgi:hypothetical protein